MLNSLKYLVFIFILLFTFQSLAQECSEIIKVKKSKWDFGFETKDLINEVNLNDNAEVNTALEKLQIRYEDTAEIAYPVKTANKIKFIKRLDQKKYNNCHYFYIKAEMLSNGIGYIQNYPEAYRLYLIAASMGHKEASYEIKRVQNFYKDYGYENKISKEEIKEARCLAEKGPYPSWMQKQLCKW